MTLENLLSNKRSQIIKRWQDAIIASYPKDSQGFLKRTKSQFANPVGWIIAKEIETLYDEVIRGEDAEKIAACLETIIRIRAVQDFRPSQAVAFVLELKDIVREALGIGPSPEMDALDRHLDKVLLIAFDVYSKCRQKIYDIRVREVKNQVGKLLERANLIVEIPETAPGVRDDNVSTSL
ncbi:MAG: RsbRD N-terminal domain-containing protein [Deltaproteobacteria bacterium]|nr:RsbRD N-terminal domain-containing protein [Deltaproteobacteria bacterium]